MAPPEMRYADGAAGDWLSGRALRSHRRGHWFDPSIAHAAQRPVPNAGTGLFHLPTAVNGSNRHQVSQGPPTVRSAAQYPPPPEFDEGLPAGAALPDAGTSCHRPPKALMPLPLALP